MRRAAARAPQSVGRVLASLEQRRAAGGRPRAAEGGELEAMEARHLSARAASDDEEHETHTDSDEEMSEDSSGSPASRCALGGGAALRWR